MVDFLNTKNCVVARSKYNGIYMRKICALCILIFSAELAWAQKHVYFKSSARDRIFVISAIGASSASARSQAEKLTYTKGQMTAVHVYTRQARTPGNVLNTYDSVEQVNNALYRAADIDRWDYTLMRYRNGAVEWVNCNKQVSDLCRDQKVMQAEPKSVANPATNPDNKLLHEDYDHWYSVYNKPENVGNYMWYAEKYRFCGSMKACHKAIKDVYHGR